MVDTPDDPPKAEDPNQYVLVPLKLDASVFNGPICDGKAPDPPTDDKDCSCGLVGAKIAPIEQPNYTLLRSSFAESRASRGIKSSGRRGGAQCSWTLSPQSTPTPGYFLSAALSKMQAFFHAGPLLVTKDVPSTFDHRELTAEDPLSKLPDVKPGEAPVRPLELGKGDWAWTQPYYPNKDDKFPDTVGGEAEALERYMVLPTGLEDEKSRFEEGPYTVVEGYLMKIGGEEKKSGK